MVVLSSYQDVSAALRNPALAITDAGTAASGAHATIREASAEFAHARLDEWRTAMEHSASEMLAGLPRELSLDLFTEFARPWSLGVAAAVSGIGLEEAASLSALAHDVFLAAARATTPGSDSHALDSAMALAQRLPPSAMAVQGFVALCHTLPHLLASAWDALLADPVFSQQLRREPAQIAQGVEELLRFAAPSRAVFRVALESVQIGSTRLARGQPVTLLLAAANRDPNQFPNPDRLDLERGSAGHLAFGKGRHACAGAQLIRLAAVTATRELLTSTTSIDRAGPVEWLDGFAIRAPTSLPVVLHR